MHEVMSRYNKKNYDIFLDGEFIMFVDMCVIHVHFSQLNNIDIIGSITRKRKRIFLG
jgi:hypothetical protein